MGRKGDVPKGSEFLKEYSTDVLLSMYRKEKDTKAKLRLLACLHRRQEKTYEEISEILFQPMMTIHDWLAKIHVKGLPSRFNKRQQGAPSKLTDEQKKKLDRVLEQSPQAVGLPCVIWTGNMVRYYIQKEFGVQYSKSQIPKILKALNYTTQKPRPEHKLANKALQEEFKKTSEKNLNRILEMDSRSFLWTKQSSS